MVNEQYRRMLEHYGMAAVPTRVRKPRDKGGVEGAVLIVERQAIAALRDRTFTSLEELNRALRLSPVKIVDREISDSQAARSTSASHEMASSKRAKNSSITSAGTRSPIASWGR